MLELAGSKILLLLLGGLLATGSLNLTMINQLDFNDSPYPIDDIGENLDVIIRNPSSQVDTIHFYLDNEAEEHEEVFTVVIVIRKNGEVIKWTEDNVTDFVEYEATKEEMEIIDNMLKYFDGKLNDTPAETQRKLLKYKIDDINVDFVNYQKFIKRIKIHNKVKERWNLNVKN